MREYSGFFKDRLIDEGCGAPWVKPLHGSFPVAEDFRCQSFSRQEAEAPSESF